MKGKVLAFILGLILGIVVAAVLWPRFVAPRLPGLGPETEAVAGTVVRKQREGERLLLTIDSPRGAALATFTNRVPEIDLLVEEGDTVTLALRDYQPFLTDPEIVAVQKTGGEAAADPAVEPITPPPAAEPSIEESPANGSPAAVELEEWPGGEEPG